MIAALILFTIFIPSSSSPLTSTSEPLRRESSNIVDTSGFRTIQGIVWNCVATIFACTWVAIHPNLPDPRTSGWSRFKQRTGIVILAVFAPEFILIWAVRQRIGAESIMKEYNRTILGINKYQRSLILQVREWFRAPSPPPCNGPLWTFAHGFYVQMGGFLLYDGETAVRVLRFRELVELVKSGAVDRPNVTEEDICDRSKGDFLTKTLVVCQTTWFIAQCILRWVSKLPVTELEVMTLAFATLNIITYGLWWEKPQNVGVGVRVQLKEKTSLWYETTSTGAALCFRRCIEGTGRRDATERLSMDVTDTSEGKSWRSSMEEINIPDSGSIEGDQGANTLSAWADVDGRDITESDETVCVPEDNFNPVPPQFTTEHTTHNLTPFDMGMEGVYRDHIRERSCARTAVRIWKLLGRLYVGIKRSELFHQLSAIVIGRHLAAHEPGPFNIGTFHAYDPIDDKFRLAILAVVCGVLFGGLHLIPWGFKFPTYSESVLWRISALYITLNPIFLSLPFLILAMVFNGAGRFIDFASRRRIFQLVLHLSGVIFTTVPLYILVRILIITLAFETLRSLPPDAYKDIPWNSFMPHIYWSGK